MIAADIYIKQELGDKFKNMAVNLDIDITYLTKHFQAIKGGAIDEKKLKEMIENGEIKELTDMNLFKDINDIIKIFKLTKPRNRFALLKLLPASDLYNLTKFLDVDELILGMKFFNKEALVKFVQKLPQEKLIAMLKEVYSYKEMFELMPERTMNKFLTNDKVEKTEILKAAKELKVNDLMTILTEATGQRPKTCDKKSLLKQMELLKPEYLRQGLCGMEKKSKVKFMSKLVENNPEYMEIFEQKDLAKVFENSSKVDILKSMQALEVEDLTKMVNCLPKEMLTMVVSQIEPDVFAEELMKNNLDLLNDLV